VSGLAAIADPLRHAVGVDRLQQLVGSVEADAQEEGISRSEVAEVSSARILLLRSIASASDAVEARSSRKPRLLK